VGTTWFVGAALGVGVGALVVLTLFGAEVGERLGATLDEPEPDEPDPELLHPDDPQAAEAHKS
jgi:hypothetical protein